MTRTYVSPPTQQIGQIIGRGGFATVHKAIHVLTAEVVAAKKFEGVKISKSNVSEIMVPCSLTAPCVLR